MPAAPKIESRDLNLNDLFKDFYSVPDFQREYVWQPENVRKLLDDITDEFGIEGGKAKTPDEEYFIGSIVVFRHGETGKYELIDGQQRLTTCYLVFCVLRDQLEQLKTRSEKLEQMLFGTQANPYTGEDEHLYRLDLQYEDSDRVLEVIGGGKVKVSDIKATTASVAHLIEAHKAIDEFLSEIFQNNPVDLKAFFAMFINRVKLIRIVTPNLSHALKIFETINDRGVGLNAMDLLKNLLFMRVNATQYAELKSRWKDLISLLDKAKEKPLRFLRYFVLSHYEVELPRGELREDQIYAWFQDNTAQTGIDRDPIGFLNELVASARAYAQFADGKNINGLPVQSLANIAALSNRARQHFIMLLAGRNLPDDVFEVLSSQLENLYFCYIITREPTKSFERIFGKWSPLVRATRDQDGMKRFVTEQIVPDLQRRVSGFDFAFDELSLNRVQKYRVRYILAKMVDYVERSAGRTPASMHDLFASSKIEIEHILPEETLLLQGIDGSVVKSAIQKLGNLTLLEKTINASIQNADFDTKRKAYPTSVFLLTQSIAGIPVMGKNTEFNRGVASLQSFDMWNIQTIDTRQKMLRRLARQIWLPLIPETDKDR